MVIAAAALAMVVALIVVVATHVGGAPRAQAARVATAHPVGALRHGPSALARTTKPTPTVVLSGSESLLAGLPSGSVSGPHHHQVAYPGQVMTAPEPLAGATAMAWSWQECPAGAGPCVSIPGAIGERYASPPTPKRFGLRVVETLDLGGAHLQVASAPVWAMPWPPGVPRGAAVAKAATKAVPRSARVAARAKTAPPPTKVAPTKAVPPKAKP